MSEIEWWEWVIFGVTYISVSAGFARWKSRRELKHERKIAEARNRALQEEWDSEQ